MDALSPNLPSTREEAKRLGLPRYFTGEPCKHGHVAERMTANRRCVRCHRLYQNDRASTPEFKERRREYDRQRWKNNQDYLIEKNRRYYTENTESVNAQKRQYWVDNIDRMREARQRWAVENRHVMRFHSAKRKKLIIRATPTWADMRAIRAVYAEAERLTIETGVLHHVDHIIPLHGEDVCGLHVHWNLRPLPWRDNIVKKNKLLDDVVVSGCCGP